MAPRSKDKHAVVSDNKFQLSGFRLLRVKFSSKSTIVHHLFIRNHAVREKSVHKPTGRTLFVVNVPSFCTESCLTSFFSTCCGDGDAVQNVHLHPTSGLITSKQEGYFNENGPSSSYQVAYVVFKEETGLNTAMGLSTDKCHLVALDDNNKLGVEKWIRESKPIELDVEKLQNEIDEFMNNYDSKMKKEVDAAKNGEGVPDDDGWITVTRHGKRPFTPRTEAAEQKTEKKEKKKRSQKELLNFYTFQVRQSKMEHIANLREKFEEDKKRIALLKNARKFKPY